MEKTYKPIFTAFEGNRFSVKLSVFFNGEKYKLIYQFFERIHPTRAEKNLGCKPYRNLLDEKTFYFTTLGNVNPDLLPCKKLTLRFLGEKRS